VAQNDQNDCQKQDSCDQDIHGERQSSRRRLRARPREFGSRILPVRRIVEPGKLSLGESSSSHKRFIRSIAARCHGPIRFLYYVETEGAPDNS
jgi:hypothetical protein